MTMRLYERQALSLLSNRLEPRVIGDVQVLASSAISTRRSVAAGIGC
jgi:hypothetical protein